MHEQTHARLLRQVHEGMAVYDRDGEYVGKVRRVYLGEINATIDDELEVVPETAPDPDANTAPFIEVVAEVFDPTDLPEEMVERLRYEGYVRIDTPGIFSEDRFALSEQLASVKGDEVRLSVTHDELVKEEV